MAADAARDVVTRYFDALGRRDLDAAAACWAPDGVDHIVGQADAQGPDGVRAYFGELFAAVPDFALVVETTIAEGDRAAVRWNATGTFAGDASYQGIAPTGGRIEISGLDLLEVRDGLIVHNDAFPDGMGFARQIGMLPPQGSTAEQRVLRAFNAKTRAGRKLAGAPAEPVADGVWRVRGGVPRAMNVYLIEDDGGGVTVFDAGMQVDDERGRERRQRARRHQPRRARPRPPGPPRHRARPRRARLCHPADRADAEGDGGGTTSTYGQAARVRQAGVPAPAPMLGRRAREDRRHASRRATTSAASRSSASPATRPG